MSPISAEMNGNVTGKEMSSKSILEDSSADGSNFSGSDSQPNSGRPLTTSTPIADQSHEENEPSSSTGSNSGGSVPKFGTKVPNRIFVGGISCQTTEEELMLLFARFGSVRATKIILDRAGVSKGYGFVTFETEEEAKRLCNAMDRKEMAPIIHRERRLNIAPAVKKQVFEPIGRQNIPYSCHGDTVSPSPTYGNAGGGAFFYNSSHQQQPEFYCPPAPIPEPFYSQTASYPQSHMQPSSAPMHQYFNNGPPPASTPNGTIYYIPVQVPPSYQQSTSGQEQWSGTSVSNFNSNTSNSGHPQQWRFHPAANLPSLSLQQNHYPTCHPGLHSAQSQSSPSQHQFLHDQYLGHAGASSFGPTDLYFINPTMISSPH